MFYCSVCIVKRGRKAVPTSLPIIGLISFVLPPNDRPARNFDFRKATTPQLVLKRSDQARNLTHVATGKLVILY